MKHYPRTMSVQEIRSLVGDKPVILEIGCNDGQDTQRILIAIPGCLFFAFEPDPRARFLELNN